MKPFKTMYRAYKKTEIRPRTIDDYQTWLTSYEDQKESQRKYDKGFIDMSFATKTWYENKLKLCEKLAKNDVAYLFGIFRLTDGEIVGYCDIATHYREDYQYATVGYAIFNQHWEQGYATEAILALISIGFEDLGFHRLEAHINIDNPISKKVVLNAGFRFEGVREKYTKEEDAWVDNEIYVCINPND